MVEMITYLELLMTRSHFASFEILMHNPLL